MLLLLHAEPQRLYSAVPYRVGYYSVCVVLALCCAALCLLCLRISVSIVEVSDA